MNFFYDKSYYQDIYKTWTVKRSIQMLVLMSFLLSFFIAFSINTTIGKYADITFLDKFMSSLPKYWEIKNHEGITVKQNRASEELKEFKHEKFKIDMTKEIFSQIDFTDKSVIISKKEIVINLAKGLSQQDDKSLYYLPISEFGEQWGTIQDLQLELDKDGILISVNNQFTRKVLMQDILTFANRFKTIVFFVILILGGILFFINFVANNWVMSLILTRILNKRGRNLNAKQTFVALTPIAFICVVLAVPIIFIFKVSFLLFMTIILLVYGIVIPVKFLRF